MCNFPKAWEKCFLHESSGSTKNNLAVNISTISPLERQKAHDSDNNTSMLMIVFKEEDLSDAT